MELMLIRHAESEGNVLGVMQGQKDYPLSEVGHQQADILGRYLATSYQDCLPDAVFCSPLQRARQTADRFIHHQPALTYEVIESLTEVDSGIFSGLTWQEAGQKYPEIQAEFKRLRNWVAVPNAESREQLWARATTFLDFLHTHHADKKRIVVLSHGGWIRALLGVLSGISHEENLFIAIDNTSHTLVGLQGSRRYIRYVNNTCHLYEHAYCFTPEAIPL